MEERLKFISYDGEYPNLCTGQLIMELDNKKLIFPEYCLKSNGSVTFTDDWEEIVEDGEWNITAFPHNFPAELKELAIELVNDNVRRGCCGGCV